MLNISRNSEAKYWPYRPWLFVLESRHSLRTERAWFGKDQDRPCKNRQMSDTENFVIFNSSELQSFRNLLHFDSVSILKHVVTPKKTWVKAFSRLSVVFGVFERIIFIERTDGTSPFLYSRKKNEFL